MADPTWENSKPVSENVPTWEESKPIDEGPSKLRSFAQGYGDAGSMGFGDEISGAIGSALEGFKPGSYTEARDFARKSRAESAAANPKSAIGGQLAGAIASGVATGKIIPTPTTALGRIALALGYGGAQGLGSSNAEDLGGMAKDTGKGAVIGGATAGAMEMVPKIGGALQSFAEGRGAKAVNLSKADRIKLGPQGVKDLGRTALDEGVIRNPFNNNTADMLKRAEVLREEGGAGMGAIYDKMDEQGLSKFSPQDVIDKFKAKEGGFYSSPANRDISGQFDNILETIGMRGENLPFSQQQALKEEMGKLSDWKSLAPSPKAQIARKAYGLVNQGIDQAANDASPFLGEDAKAILQQAKDKYGAGATMAGTKSGSQVGTLENKLATESAKGHGLGLGDLIFGATGATLGSAGGPVGAGFGAIKGLAAKQVVNQVSNPASQAWTADKVGKILTASPQVFGKYAQPLQNAAARGMPALSATNFILTQTQPEYREIKRQLNGQESPEGR